MEKISIVVTIPALGGTFDFLVPGNMLVRNAQQLILKILSSDYGVSDMETNVMLFDMSDRMALRPDCSFNQLAIPDGARLLML